jgi:post-segregation antitoxin (ccd killing protein)
VAQPKSRAGQPIRKVWLPATMKQAVNELCWRNRTKPSPYLLDIIQEVAEHSERFEGAHIPPAGNSYISVYIDDESWERGLAAAADLGVRLSALVRVAIARDLTEAHIPWDATTTRPRNDHIPIRE